MANSLGTPQPAAQHPVLRRPGGHDPMVAGLTADSRCVQPGYLFAALPGSKLDGRRFIPDALARGCAAVLAVPGTQLPEGASAILIEDPAPRRRLALMAAAFCGPQPETMVAVTGTNGKTSTVQFVRQLWQSAGHAAASLGTLGLQSPSLNRPGSLTTPDTVALHQDLAALAAAGVTHAAMEASSHGLDQNRLDGVSLKAAGFTNLTRDHLDYHGSMEAYFAAKRALFDHVLPAEATAVLNADVPSYSELAQVCSSRGQRVWSYGGAGKDLVLREVDAFPGGQTITAELFGRRVRVDVPLAGRFQVWNLLCALGLVLADAAQPDQEIDRYLPALGSLDGVPGRMQLVAVHPSGAPIYVDYAHTPDALETVLTALRPHVMARLLVVFGCGGDRDPGKRPIMGEVSGRLADLAIVTDDNPRTEDPALIRRAAMAGSPRPLVDIGDRADAIRAAVARLHEGDVLVIAGKGHEPGQTIGTETRPFDDAEEVRAAVALLGGKEAGHG